MDGSSATDVEAGAFLERNSDLHDSTLAHLIWNLGDKRELEIGVIDFDEDLGNAIVCFVFQDVRSFVFRGPAPDGVYEEYQFPTNAQLDFIELGKSTNAASSAALSCRMVGAYGWESSITYSSLQARILKR